MATTRQPTSGTDLATRVTAVETAVGHLSQSFDDFVRTTKENNESLRVEIRNLTASVSKQQRVNWPLVATVFFGIFALLATSAGLVSLVGTLAVKPIEQHQGFMQQAITEQREDLKQLDATLQREMRALDAVQDAKIQRLDERLQREMQHLDAAQNSHITHVKELLLNLDEKLKNHMQQADHPLGVVAQIKELEGHLRTLRARLDALAE